jgi:hypothetical protein
MTFGTQRFQNGKNMAQRRPLSDFVRVILAFFVGLHAGRLLRLLPAWLHPVAFSCQ